MILSNQARSHNKPKGGAGCQGQCRRESRRSGPKWDADDQKWLADFLKAVEEKYRDTTMRMVLFGSRARGDWNEDSDIDVLVIVRNEASGAKNGIQELGAS